MDVGQLDGQVDWLVLGQVILEQEIEVVVEQDVEVEVESGRVIHKMVEK